VPEVYIHSMMFTGEPDECLLSSGSSEQPNWRVKYGSDYKGTTMPVCSQDLLCWAFQVARGMEYLASHKVRKIFTFVTKLWEIIFSPLKYTSFFCCMRKLPNWP
jgi:hypothetical protein